MTTRAERQAADVGYTGDRYQRPGGTSHEVLAIPEAWFGKYVDFDLDDSDTTNQSYVLFGSASDVAATISPTDSAVDGTTKAMTAITTGGSHLCIRAGQPRPIRIPASGIAFLSHIEVAATGKLRMTLSTGDGT